MMLHEDRYAFLAILDQIHDTSGVRLDIFMFPCSCGNWLKSRRNSPHTSKAALLFTKRRKASGVFQRTLI